MVLVADVNLDPRRPRVHVRHHPPDAPHRKIEMRCDADGVVRSAVEGENGVRDALRLSGLDGAAVFCGKALAVAAQLAALEVVLGIGVVVLYDLHLHNPLVVVAASLIATAGLAAAGTVYGVLAAGLRVRETLFPLLVLPVVAPVMLGATRAWEAALSGAPSEAWPWVQLLVVFCVIYVTMGWLAFGPLLEET